MADAAPETGQEFFYFDEDGTKQDADLHNAIIGPVDFPIDETIMAPIRARHRAEHLAQHKAKARALRWQRIKAKARKLATGHNGLYKVWNEDDHPRAPAGGPDGGQFTGGGGSGGGGSGAAAKPQPTGTGAGAGNAGGVSQSFSRESAGDAERSRNVVAVYTPTPAAAKAMRAQGHTPLTFHELSGAGAQTFHDAIVAAKSGKYGAAVNAYSADDYAHMRLFLTPDHSDGFALKGDDIVSVFKFPKEQAKGVATTMLALATEQGGRRLDCFDTQLPFLYAKSGFTPVARLKWNEEHKPEGWDKSTFKEFNGGEPDVVFMVHSATTPQTYRAGSGSYVPDYDSGTAAQGFATAKQTNNAWIAASPIKTIDDIKREAPKAQKMLGDVGRQIASELGLPFKDPGPKTKTPQGVQRVIEKANERGVSLAAVTDTARATFLVDHPGQTDQIIARLAEHFEVAPEPWRVTDMNYGDRAVNVRLPNGVIAEVQMMHPAMAEAKSPEGGGGHDLYKISRESAPQGVRPDPVKYADAMAKQRALYGKVYEGLSDDWKAAFGSAGKSG